TASGAPTVRVAGAANFTSQTAGGPINRLDVRIDSVVGLDAADVSLNGGTLCTVATFGGVAIGIVSRTFASPTPLHLCGAPGATLFEICPPQAAARVVRRRDFSHLRDRNAAVGKYSTESCMWAARYARGCG